jgi:O-antigen ligase
MALLLPVVAALVSILIAPGLSFYFDVIPKVVVALIGASFALGSFRRWPATHARPFKWFTILLAAQAATTVLATLFSTHRSWSLMGSVWRRSGLFAEFAVLVLALMVAGHLAAGRTSLRLFLRITVLTAVPVAIYGILQYFGIDPFLTPADYQFGEGRFMIVRPPSTMGHAAYFATYLLYAVFGGAALALSETGRAWKTAALAALGLASFALVLSGTRAALVGLIAGALFLGVRRWDWRWAGGAIAMLALIAGFYVTPAGERLRARAFWSSQDPLGGARLLLWRDTLRMSRERWLVGYGPETFSLEFPHYQSIELARAFPDFYHESPHNIFLDALVSKGILGLLPLIALCALGIATARGPMGGAFVAMLVSQQFTTFTLPTELYFFVCLAILVSDFKPEAVRMLQPQRWRWVLALPFACFAIYLAAGDFLLASARRALDRGDFEAAARSIDQARKLNATADYYFSRRTLSLNPRYAMNLAARASQTAEDRQNALINLAAFRSMVDDARGVEQTLRVAIAAAPNWFKPHWLLAQVLARDGRMVEAEAEARAAVERDGGKDPEVTQTLEQLQQR